jgi:hypothetical protein
MTRDQITQTLSNTKVFLDFGHHPGKDRVPREAALCGAIPVIRREGAARFEQDVPLPSSLLVETDVFFDNEALKAKLVSVIEAADTYQPVLEEYCNWIRDEGRRFDDELKELMAAN